ncbi:MAG: LysE family transporter [Eubacteriaceae bacterium]
MLNWINFLTYAIITAITPGPNNIMSMSNASRMGFKKAIPFNLGVWCGFSIVMLVCTLFCGLVSQGLPKIKLPMLIIGAIYMLYLAWKTFKSSPQIKENDSKSGFTSGLVLQFINPKIYIYCIISMEAYILPYYSSEPLILFLFAMLLAFIGFVCTLGWSIFGSMFKLLFSKYAKVTNTMMALLLIYCAITLFF